jgi:hypothetical protein
MASARQVLSVHSSHIAECPPIVQGPGLAHRSVPERSTGRENGRGIVTVTGLAHARQSGQSTSQMVLNH